MRFTYKYIIVVVFLFMVCNVCYAHQIDVKEAVEIAYNFFGKRVNSDFYDDIDITTFYGENGTYLYGIGMKGGGWTIVSSDDRLHTVYGTNKES